MASEYDAKVSEIVIQIKPQLEDKSGKTFETIEVVQYKTQQVDGTNYCVKARAKGADGAEQIVHLMIHQSPEGDLELSEHQLNKQLEDEIRFGCCCA